jgi:hypothetical protein
VNPNAAMTAANAMINLFMMFVFKSACIDAVYLKNVA